MNALSRLSEHIERCTRCPRLVGHCRRIAVDKKREFRDQDYWGKPVPGFGDPNAWLWIIGLAPAAHGANRTGRMFTGDSSGHWLYRALYKVGLASQERSMGRTDGMKLSRVYISAAARCAPPDNKPTPKELKNCASFLETEWDLLEHVTTILALGKIAFDATQALAERKGVKAIKPRFKFAHHSVFEIGQKRLVASYHPSRQNTQTGRLTERMWMEVFEGLKNHSARKGQLVRTLQANRL